MNNKEYKLAMYTDLDSILDTRISLLKAISSIDMDKILDTYRERSEDSFDFINYRLFNKLYSKRNKKILVNAPITGVVSLMCDFYIDCKTTHSISYDGPFTIKFYVNTFPYKLNDSEQDHIKNMLLSYINGDIAEVILMCKDPKDVTTDWIDKNVAMVILYDGLEYMEKQASIGNAIRKPITDTALLVPKILSGVKGKIKHYTDQLEKSYGTLINLAFIKTEYFCYNIKK